MVTGATSLSLVRDELFATMEEAEQSLEHFIIDRNNGGLLQQAVENPARLTQFFLAQCHSGADQLRLRAT